MDTESTLDEYQSQLEQVDLALQRDPNNEELIKLKEDLVEVISLTKDLLNEERANSKFGSSEIDWKSTDKCMAIWRIDGRYYPATLDQVLEDGTCTVIFDGYKTSEVTQVGLLKPHNKNASSINNDVNSLSKMSAATGKKSSFTKKELESRIREAKKKKKEKYAAKIKEMDDVSEKDKNRWKNFNSKLQSKTWKGVVKKNKFDIPVDHENKIGVGTNAATNRIITANGTILPINTSATASASILNSSLTKSRHVSKSYKTSTFR